MKYDIFIDNNVACRFANPLDEHYKRLVAWLNENPDISQNAPDTRAVLVVSKKLLHEYMASCRGAAQFNAIPVLVDRLTRQGRVTNIGNDSIKEFKNQHYTNAIERRLKSNNEDREHIPVVLLSDRKYALTNDENLTKDLNNFPGFKVLVSDRPEKIPYRG